MTSAAETLAAFIELREFWRTAYQDLAKRGPLDEATILKEAATSWCHDLWHGAEGWCPTGDEVMRYGFESKLPEPYFGRWTDANGSLDVARKIVVCMINPGNGIPFDHYYHAQASTLARGLSDLLVAYYEAGGQVFDAAGVAHHLLYKRKLRNPKYEGVANTRRHGWTWWKTAFENILRSIGTSTVSDDEEDRIVTLELFAYQSTNRSRLDANLARRLQSTRLVVQLIARLATLEDAAARPAAIVLVNCLDVWQPALEDALNATPAPGAKSRLKRVVSRGPICGPQINECEDASHVGRRPAVDARFACLLVDGSATPTRVTMLHKAQHMFFPARNNGGKCVFG